MYGFALVCSPTIREAVKITVKYHRLATPLLSMSWRDENDAAGWVLTMEQADSHPESLVRFLLEQQLTQIRTHLRTLVEPDRCHPVYVALPYAAPRHINFYRQYFGCELRFNQPACKLFFPKSMLSAKPHMAHPITAKLMRDTCDRILGELKTSTGVAGEVYQIIASTSGRSPTMKAVASHLATTVRTLRRKLETEDTSFTRILDDVRCNIAKEYLKSTTFSIDEISELVGFSDAANFRHAFRRWTGSTPAHFRR